MKKIIYRYKIILAIMILLILSVINFSFAEVIRGKFVRFGVDSVVIKTENEVLNLPISKDLKVVDMNGNVVSAASLYEGADITINYDQGYVISISVDKFNPINQVNNPNNNLKPEYQILLKNYQNNINYTSNYEIPVKVSYVGYLPVDYQYIYGYRINPESSVYPYYSYTPVTNYGYASYDLKLYKDYLAYDNMLLTNSPSKQLYYELKSSELNNNLPNYYYLAQFQPTYLENPNKNNIPTNESYLAKSNNNAINNGVNTNMALDSSVVFGRLVYMDKDSIGILTYDNSNLSLKIDETTNIFVKKEGKYVLVNSNKLALNEILNKNVQVAVKNYNGQLIANTVIIENQ